MEIGMTIKWQSDIWERDRKLGREEIVYSVVSWGCLLPEASWGKSGCGVKQPETGLGVLSRK